MLHAAASIARFTILEGLRTRLLVAVVGVLVVVVVAAEFSVALAITDSQSYRIGIYAAGARVAVVMVMILFVATSAVRELELRSLDLTWSRPVARGTWLVGRLLGFCVLATVVAGLTAAPLLLMNAPLPVLLWGVSLAAELCLLSAACLTCVITLRQVMLAVTVTIAFYILARALDAIVAMSRGPLFDPNAWTQVFVARAVEYLALLLPALDRFTRAAWLGADALPAELAPVLLQSAIYIAVLLAIGLFDVYRVND